MVIIFNIYLDYLERLYLSAQKKKTVKLLCKILLLLKINKQMLTMDNGSYFYAFSNSVKRPFQPFSL